jgi:4-hydroxybenzoate polyprenyltransferase
MVIDVGKSQVFKWKVPETLQCPVIRQNPGPVIAENLTNLVLGHGRLTLYLNCWSPRAECRIIGAHMWIWDKLKITLEMIKFEHTIFALPFALIGALLASHGLPSTWQIGWILVAMVGARSAAMAFNRIVDVQFDRLNPRTASRALPAGTLSRRFAVIFTLATSALFVFAAWQLNTLCFYLSFPLLGILLLYSYTKRFTAWSHLFLGASIGMAPLAAWLAIQGSFAWPPVLLSLAVMFWVAGFDVIYSLQDAEFDRSARLFSLPSRLGIAPALHISTAFHGATVALLVATALMTSLGNVAFAGIAVVAAILFWEHRIVKPDDLSRVNLAFFSLNGYISFLLLLTFATDILIK